MNRSIIALAAAGPTVLALSTPCPAQDPDVVSPIVSYQYLAVTGGVSTVSPIVSYQFLALSDNVSVASPIVSYQFLDLAGSLFSVTPIVSYSFPPPGTQDQPQPGQDLPILTVTLDHLWQWNDGDGRFLPSPSGMIAIDPSKPTYLLTHGWDGSLDGSTCGDLGMESIGCAIFQAKLDAGGDLDANLLAWDWKQTANPNGACDFPDQLVNPVTVFLLFHSSQPAAVALVALGAIVYDARKAGQQSAVEGNKLGQVLNALIAESGQLGSEFHLIGKSHGGGVLGRAARILTEHGYPPDSLTILDTPKVTCIEPFCFGNACTPQACLVNSLKYVQPDLLTPDVRVVNAYYPDAVTGFGRELTGCYDGLTNLALNEDHVPGFSIFDPLSFNWVAHLWIGGPDDGVCPTSDGWYPSGVWDPSLGAPRPVSVDGVVAADSPLDALQLPDGSFVEESEYHFATVGCTEGAAGDGESETPGLSPLRYEPFTTAASWFGNLTQLVVGPDPADPANRVILMQEQGDASFFKDIEWPDNALEITFDYLFQEPRGGESLTVYFDDQIVYYDNAETTLATDQLTSSGAIYVGKAAGQTGRLNFVLRTDGTFGGSLVLDNLRVFGLVPGDAELDGDLDLLNFAAFQDCLGRAPDGDPCAFFDFDQSKAVDLVDYATLNAAFKGPALAPPP